jgi:hypothetical protein
MTAPTLESAAFDAATGPVVITEPGVYDLTDDEYHSDPVPGGSLSSTGARTLAGPAGAAKFRYEQDNPKRKTTKALDYGRAAHSVVLGKGAGIVVVEATDWRTNKAKDQAKQAREAGKIPMLPHDYEIVLAMADAIKAHPFAAKLLASNAGAPERALFWRDGSIMRRALLDWLRDPNPNRRTIVTDYKTCDDASDEAFSKAMDNYKYHQQAGWYLDGVEALELTGNGEPPVFLFIAQEKKAPYLVNVIQPDPDSLAIGRHHNRLAIATYKECMASGVWPGYGTEPKMISLPPYVVRQYEKEPWMQ